MAKSGVKAAVQEEVPQTWKKVLSGVLLTLGAITFFLAQSTLWVSNNFFNEDVFVGTVQEVLSTEESRQAIANTIVHTALENNPVAEQLIGKQATALVTGLLGTDIVGQLFDRVAHRAYAYLTSSNRQDIAINLESVKDPLTKIVAIAERGDRDVKFDPSKIPDSITLVDSESLPDISAYIRMILFASGLLWFATIASFVTYIYLNRMRLVRSIYWVGASIIIVSLIGLFSGPFIPPAIASLVNVIEVRSVVEDLTEALLYPFQVQLLSGMVITALVLLLVSLRGPIKLGIVKIVSLFR